MVDVFISYSRADQDKVGMLARMIASEGYQVWWDADLPPHMSYGDAITAKIGAAKAAVVVWSDTAAKSEWVRAEADVARNQKKLIQTSLDDVLPPLPFNQIQCAAIGDWNGESDHAGWGKVKESLAALCGPRANSGSGSVSAVPADILDAAPPPAPAPRPSPAPTGPASTPPAPASAVSTQAQGPSYIPIIAGVAVALIALISAVLIVLFGLGQSAEEGNGPVPVASVETPENVAASPSDDTGSQGSAEAAQHDPAPAAVPERREWLFATVEDSDGFSNVRARPTTSSEIIGTVREGERFSTWRQEGSWWQVELSDGKRGYIYRRLIRLLGNDTAIAPPDTPRVPIGPTGMVFADSSSRLLGPSDLSGLNAGSLRIAQNEIYARLGYRFDDDALRTYFSRFDWYAPRYDTVTLNAVERRNIELIREAEARLGR